VPPPDATIRRQTGTLFRCIPAPYLVAVARRGWARPPRAPTVHVQQTALRKGTRRITVGLAVDRALAPGLAREAQTTTPADAERSNRCDANQRCPRDSANDSSHGAPVHDRHRSTGRGWGGPRAALPAGHALSHAEFSVGEGPGTRHGRSNDGHGRHALARHRAQAHERVTWLPSVLATHSTAHGWLESHPARGQMTLGDLRLQVRAITSIHVDFAGRVFRTALPPHLHHVHERPRIRSSTLMETRSRQNRFEPRRAPKTGLLRRARERKIADV
jgi:hypothetical protein